MTLCLQGIVMSKLKAKITILIGFMLLALSASAVTRVDFTPASLSETKQFIELLQHSHLPAQDKKLVLNSDASLSQVPASNYVMYLYQGATEGKRFYLLLQLSKTDHYAKQRGIKRAYRLVQGSLQQLNKDELNELFYGDRKSFLFPDRQTLHITKTTQAVARCNQQQLAEFWQLFHASPLLASHHLKPYTANATGKNSLYDIMVDQRIPYILYKADVDNDGKDEYILVREPWGCGSASIGRIYKVDNKQLKSINLQRIFFNNFYPSDYDYNSRFYLYLGEPLLLKGDKTYLQFLTYFTVADSAKFAELPHKFWPRLYYHCIYLWQGQRVRLVNSADFCIPVVQTAD